MSRFTGGRVLVFATRAARCTRGNITMLFGISALALSGLIGGAVSLAQVSAAGGYLQDSADAGAVNVAVAIRDGGDPDALEALADTSIGGRNGRNRVELISRTPITVSFTASREVRPILGPLIGRETVQVTRRATAVVEAGKPVCLLVLSASQPQALSRRGASSLEGPNCVAQVNSSSPEAIESRGSGTVEMLQTRVTGSGTDIGGFTPAPTLGAPRLTDPYADTDWPAAGACARLDISVKKTVLSLAAGVHCGDIDLGSGSELVMGPGVHIITGSLTMRAGARLIATQGSSLVFVGESSTLDIQAQSELRITAPTTGPWAGVAIAVKPQATERTSEILGGGQIVLDGAVYLPTQLLYLTGGGSLADPTGATRAFVVNRLELRGNGRVFLNAGKARARTGAGVRLIE